jgi:hypothetical protein
VDKVILYQGSYFSLTQNLSIIFWQQHSWNSCTPQRRSLVWAIALCWWQSHISNPQWCLSTWAHFLSVYNEYTGVSGLNIIIIKTALCIIPLPYYVSNSVSWGWQLTIPSAWEFFQAKPPAPLCKLQWHTLNQKQSNMHSGNHALHWCIT